MKKFYLLSLLCCLRLVAVAQTITTFTPTGGPLSFSTGSSDGAVRSDDIIISNTVPGSGGYSVFDLSSIPAGAQIMGCELGFYVNSVTGIGSASNCVIYAFPSDLSLITSAPILYNTMLFGGTNVATPVDYGILPGTQTASNPILLSWIQANYGSGKVSIAWTGGGLLSYGITGETGVAPTPIATPPPGHQPYLHITYCSQPTLSVTATPNPICEKETLTLKSTLTGADGALVYAWKGPAAYTSAAVNPTLTTALTSAGVYSLTVTSKCTAAPLPAYTFTVTAATLTVTVNPVPAAITGASVICLPPGATSKTVLTETSSGGNWSSSNSSIASVLTGTVSATGPATGAVTISYTYPTTGCYSIFPMKVNAPPVAITGPTAVCEASTITLVETSGGGAWSASPTAVGSVSTGGVVTGVGPGSATISYTIPGCPTTTHTVTVHPLPPPITGGNNVCFTNNVRFSDAMGGGTWSTASTTVVAFLPFPKGNLTALTSSGTATITYTTTFGCVTTLSLVVDPALAPITGTSSVCEHDPVGTILSDATVSDAIQTGYWTTGSSKATVDISTGQVVGVSAGTASITYNLGGCKEFFKVTITPAPFPISGPSVVCQNDSFFVSDASTGATWSSSDVTVATIDAVTGFVRTPGVSGPGGIYITYTYPTSSCYSVYNILVKKSPDATLTYPATTFCSGTTTLSVSVPAGSQTYQWYFNGVAISGATGISHTTGISGLYTIKIDNTLGCSTTSTPILVISGLAPTMNVSGKDTFCTGNSAILTADPHGSLGLITYQWTKNGTNIVGANLPTYVAATTGVYNCEVTVAGTSGSCTVPTTDADILVHPAPTPSIAYVSKILRTDVTYAAYQWYLNTVAVPGATKSTYRPAKTGKYMVVVYDDKGCAGPSTTVQITTVGVNDLTRVADVKVYPNPATSILHIESATTVNVVITSMEGKTVLTQNNAKEINISNLANGLYFVMLFDEHGERLAMEKLVKE
jgi:Secretion system C-terminal sorting domain